MSESGEGRLDRQRRLEKEKAAVISALQENPDDLSPLHAYLDHREKEVRDSTDALHLNISVARIYKAAGLIEAAREAFYDAAEQALQEGSDALYLSLHDERDQLPSGGTDSTEKS